MPNDFLYPVPDLALGQFHRVEQTIKRSRFICTAAHVTSPEEAKAFIDQIRVEFSDARLHCGVGEIAVVVTRYFGGILLGTGGLIRAYQGTVKFALETLPTAERLVTVPLRVTIEHRYVTQFLRLLPQYRASISESNFGMDAEYVLAIPRDAIPALTKDLTELTSGSVLVEPPEED